MTIKNVFLLITVASVVTLFLIIEDWSKAWPIALLSVGFLIMVIRRYKKS